MGLIKFKKTCDCLQIPQEDEFGDLEFQEEIQSLFSIRVELTKKIFAYIGFLFCQEKKIFKKSP